VSAHRRPEIRFSEAPRGTCRWCGEPILYGPGPKEGTVDRRRRWHPACVAAYNASDPREVRRRLRRRDRGRCAACGLDTVALRRELRGRGMTRALRKRGFVPRRSLWEVDHVVPLVDGGSHDLDNLQTLCTPCHRAKTAEEARARAERLRAAATATGESTPPDAASAPMPAAPGAADPPVATDPEPATVPARTAPRAAARMRRRPPLADVPLGELLDQAARVNARVESMLRGLAPKR